MGGVVIILLIVFVLLYRRHRHQRKLKQFHRERMLLHQQPPPSFLSSAGTGTILPPVTSPKSMYATRALSPNRHSGVPLGMEEAVKKNSNSPYNFPPDVHSESHYSPSASSVALPQEQEPNPVFRAQHAPGMIPKQV